MVDIEGFITLGPVARGHHREGTASSAWLLPHEHLGDPPRWSCWRRSTDETGWNCGPVRSGKICATQIVGWLIRRLVSITKGVWLPTVRGEGAIMSGLLPGGGEVMSSVSVRLGSHLCWLRPGSCG